MNKSTCALTLYACGGAGINIASAIEQQRGVSDVGMAAVETYYIDTSRSNLLKKSIPAEHVYIFEDMDGSGKKRNTNASVISDNTLALLQKFKPGKFNVVLHSGSGG
jgi:hypothetical protein